MSIVRIKTSKPNRHNLTVNIGGYIVEFDSKGIAEVERDIVKDLIHKDRSISEILSIGEISKKLNEKTEEKKVIKTDGIGVSNLEDETLVEKVKITKTELKEEKGEERVEEKKEETENKEIEKDEKTKYREELEEMTKFKLQEIAENSGLLKKEWKALSKEKLINYILEKAF